MKILEVVTDPAAIAKLQAPARRPRVAASLSSWAVVDVRVSARRGVALGFARPGADTALGEHAERVSKPTKMRRGTPREGQLLDRGSERYSRLPPPRPPATPPLARIPS